MARAQVVDDRRARMLQQKGLREKGGDEISRDEVAGAIDKKAPIGVAVPRDPDVGLLGNDALHDVAAVFLDERIRFVVRKTTVDLETQPGCPAGKALEQLGRDQSTHAGAGIENNGKW